MFLLITIRKPIFGNNNSNQHNVTNNLTLSFTFFAFYIRMMLQISK